MYSLVTFQKLRLLKDLIAQVTQLGKETVTSLPVWVTLHANLSLFLFEREDETGIFQADMNAK